MLEEPKHMKEIHNIRERLAKKRKGMSIEEEIKATRKAAVKAEERIKELREKRQKDKAAAL